MNATLSLSFPAQRRATFFDLLAALWLTLRGLLTPDGSFSGDPAAR